MNKKKIIEMLLIALMIFNVGCTNNISSVKKESVKSREITFEENVLESSNANIKINQEEIRFNTPENTRFDFRFFKDGKIYGSLSSIFDNTIDLNKPIGYPRYGAYKENLYVVDDDYDINDTGLKLLVEDESEGIKGINSQYYGTDRHTVNYYNYETNELTKITF